MGEGHADAVVKVLRFILDVPTGLLVIGNIGATVDDKLTMCHLLRAFVVGVVWGHLSLAIEV